MSRLWLRRDRGLGRAGSGGGATRFRVRQRRARLRGRRRRARFRARFRVKNKDQPIHIEAATLEVHDKAKTATFSGNVQVVQGDTTMRCRSLVVFYGAEEGAGTAAKPAAARPAAGGPATPGLPQGAQSIRRIEARGGVTVVAKDQNASGELGVYDLKTKTITLTGNVVVSQGKNVLHGERVVVDTATGNARVESGATTTTGCGRSFSRARAPTAPRPMSCRLGKATRIEGAATGIRAGNRLEYPAKEPVRFSQPKVLILACPTSSHIFAGARPRHQPRGIANRPRGMEPSTSRAWAAP